MNKNTLIQRNPLFAGLTAGETADAVRRLNGREETYERGNVIFPAGENNTHAGIILSGGVNLEMSDIWGGRTIIGHSGPGDIFGEAYACCTEERMLVDAVASEETEVLLIDIGPIVNATGHRRPPVAAARPQPPEAHLDEVHRALEADELHEAQNDKAPRPRLSLRAGDEEQEPRRLSSRSTGRSSPITSGSTAAASPRN